MDALYDITGRELKLASDVDDNIIIVTITGTLPTDKSQGDVPVVIAYDSGTLSFTNYATVKVQGDSSARYPKKNFTIKLYKDSARTKKSKYKFRDWDKERSKFVLKANWIDHSHARNIVNARLWKQVVESRTDYDSLPAQLREGNKAIDGFLVKVYNNGIYMGLYTWNLPKDAMYGLDDDLDENAIVQSEGDVDNASLLFRSTTMNGKWADELHGSMPQVIATSWTSVLEFVNNSTDAEFISQLNSKLDLQSIIDVQIFLIAGAIIDNLGKNQTFYTYDAVKWYAGMYDMDGTWGLPPFAPTSWLSPTLEFQGNYKAVNYGFGTNLLHERLTNLFTPQIKSRYAALRERILSPDNICAMFDEFMSTVPADLYPEDFASTTGNGEFTDIPLHDTNNIIQIRNYVVNRMAYVDTVLS